MKTVCLYAPEGYVAASPEVRSQLTNGCGAGGWKLDLVPDSLLGLDILPACNIHDWMYSAGETLADKQEADRVFLNNMLRLIETDSSCWILKHIRRKLARGYFEAVEHFGGPAFWEGKNPAGNMVEVYI